MPGYFGKLAKGEASKVEPTKPEPSNTESDHSNLIREYFKKNSIEFAEKLY